jgi:hypothetical protein
MLVCFFVHALENHVNLPMYSGPVKPALLSMDDGSNSALPDGTDEFLNNPSKGMPLLKIPVHVTNFE